MKKFSELDATELAQIRGSLMQRYRAFQAQAMNLDMTRGKPCPEQLDLSLGLLTCLDKTDILTASGTDCRNYGGVDGIPEAKNLFAQYLEVDPEEIIIGGNSSLAMMHDTFMRAMLKGVEPQTPPWVQLPEVKFLCPSPGYDRHFFICEYLGIKMIPVKMNAEGPDMDQVETLVASDESIKGIWCVPLYSNPTAAVYSDTVIDRLASMKTRAKDFRIFCDNAYAVHHLDSHQPKVKNMLAACKQAGNPDRIFLFGSTSKITFAGAGIAMMAGSKKTMARARKQINIQTIGPDKLNQLRHVKFFKTTAGIKAHMAKHAAIIKPKFDAILSGLEKELGGKQIAWWTRPQGGYFISLDTLPGCATAVVRMAAEAGVKLTPAGSTFPYGKDPDDRNIRLAPTFPDLEDIRSAIELVGICIQLVSIERNVA
jgi:DNA-binding transcriptional MocR family regulator